MQGCHSFRQFPIYLSLSGYLDKLMFFGLTEISLYRTFLMEILHFYHNHVYRKNIIITNKLFLYFH